MVRNILLFFSLTLYLNVLQAQNWHKLKPLPPDVSLKQTEVSPDGTIYVLTDDDQVFYSTDNGMHWFPVSPPPFSNYTSNARKLHYNKSTATLFIGTSLNGLSLMKSFGSVWDQEFFSTNPNSGIHEGISNINSNGNLIVVSGDFDFFSGHQRYFFSQNNGNTWSSARLGLALAEDIYVDSSGHWLVATSAGLQRTTDQAASWTVVAFQSQRTMFTGKMSSGEFYVLVKDSTSTTHHIYSSPNLSNWSLRSTFTSQNVYDISVTPFHNGLFVSMEEGLFIFDEPGNALNKVSHDPATDASEIPNGAAVYTSPARPGLTCGSAPLFNWETRAEGLFHQLSFSQDKFIFSDSIIYSISAVSRLVSACSLYGPYLCNPSYLHDTAHPAGSVARFLFEDSSGTLYAGGPLNVYRKTTSGWKSLLDTSQIPPRPGFTGLYSVSLFTATADGTLFLTQENDSMKLWISTDKGNSWQKILDQNILSGLGFPNSIRYNGIASEPGGKWFISLQTLSLDHKLITSNNLGVSWTNATPNFFQNLPGPVNLLEGADGKVYGHSGTNLLNISDSALIVSTPWTQTGDISRILPVINSNGEYFVNVIGLPSCIPCGVYRGDGNNWSFLGTPDILPDYLPFAGLELLEDTVPVIRTAYRPSEGPVSQMAYYYFRSTPLNPGTSEEKAFNSEITLFPNPTTGRFRLNTDEKVRAEISDITGKHIVTKTVRPGEEIDLTNAGRGIYLVRITAGEIRHTVKLIIR